MRIQQQPLFRLLSWRAPGRRVRSADADCLAAQLLTREGIVFRPFVDELLTVQTGLGYLREDASPILKSLRKFLFETFKPLSPDLDTLGKSRARQMALF